MIGHQIDEPIVATDAVEAQDRVVGCGFFASAKAIKSPSPCVRFRSETGKSDSAATSGAEATSLRAAGGGDHSRSIVGGAHARGFTSGRSAYWLHPIKPHKHRYSTWRAGRARVRRDCCVWWSFE